MSIVSITIYISILIQFISGLIGLDGFTYKLNKKDEILKDILKLETGVQFLELIFYIIFATISIPLNSLAGIRYYDWFFTTPTMLISSMMYFAYLNNNDKESEEALTIRTFLEKHFNSIMIIVGFNALMLISGFMGEMKVISMLVSLIAGFVFFGVSFFEIYKSTVKSVASKSFPMFFILTIIWSIYGILFPFSPIVKNTFFNLLDLVSKNFYGLYIYYLILQKKIA